MSQVVRSFINTIICQIFTCTYRLKSFVFFVYRHKIGRITYQLDRVCTAIKVKMKEFGNWMQYCTLLNLLYHYVNFNDTKLSTILSLISWPISSPGYKNGITILKSPWQKIGKLYKHQNFSHNFCLKSIFLWMVKSENNWYLQKKMRAKECIFYLWIRPVGSSEKQGGAKPWNWFWKSHFWG